MLRDAKDYQVMGFPAIKVLADVCHSWQWAHAGP